MLSPQVTQGDTGGRGLDADGEDMAVGVIDAQQDLAPPGAFILLLYLAQLKQFWSSSSPHRVVRLAGVRPS